MEGWLFGLYSALVAIGYFALGWLWGFNTGRKR